MSYAEEVAKAFHEEYEKLAPDFGYKTRKTSAVPWEKVPEQNKNLMIAVVDSLIKRGILSNDYFGVLRSRSR